MIIPSPRELADRTPRSASMSGSIVDSWQFRSRPAVATFTERFSV